MATSFVASLQDLWDAWGIRGFMILSLTMQLLLEALSRFRKVTSNRWFILLIWSAYFLADWVAIFAFGLISNARCRNSTSPPQVDQDILAFWSAFLLIHLGGPDSITAYALEDNALWMRHLVGLGVQLLAFLNIFVKTLPRNDLRVPIVLIAIAGVIRYWERSRALRLASVENLKKSIVKSRRFGLDRNTTRTEGLESQSNTSRSDSDEDTSKATLKTAFHYFKIFRGLVVDVMPDHSEWLETRDFFLKQDARVTFKILVKEQKLFYEVLYTKVLGALSVQGQFARALAFYTVLAALIMFCLIKKAGIHEVDVRITYSLLAGGIALSSSGAIMFSSWSRVDIMAKQVIDLTSPEWSESTGALSILRRAFEESRPRKGSKLCDCWRKINGKMNDKMGVVILTELQYEWENELDMELWDFVFGHLREKASTADDADKVRAVYEARGEGPLRNMNLAELRQYVDDMEFENSILIWHCATEICYQVDGHIDGDCNKRRKFSKVLSDYLVYLLIKQPKLMSPVAGIEEIWCRDTLNDAKTIGNRHLAETMDQFCQNILNEQMGTAESDDRTGKEKSVLSNACSVAHTLRQEGSTKWDVISEVWVEMLSYAAGHCRADSHVRLVSEGGEFIIFVWLLMAHFGIIARVPKK